MRHMYFCVETDLLVQAVRTCADEQKLALGSWVRSQRSYLNTGSGKKYSRKHCVVSSESKLFLNPRDTVLRKRFEV